MYEWALNQQKARSNKGSPTRSSSTAKSNSTTTPKYSRARSKSSTKKASEKKHNQRGFSTRKTASPPVYKKFEIKESGIPNSDKGLFLKESAEVGEKIARYSGIFMTQEEADNKSDSQYLLQISKNPRVILCADGPDKWEGKFAQDGPKSGIKANARFGAATVVNECSKSGRLHCQIIALKRFKNTGGEVFVDYRWND